MNVTISEHEPLVLKKFSACQDGLFKNPYWYFRSKKNLKLFLEWSQKKVFFISIDNVKKCWKIIYDIKTDKNDLLMSFCWLFSAKSPILGTLSTFEKISCASLNLYHQDVSFKYPYDYILSDKFFDQKRGKIGRNLKFCQNRLNHSILHYGSQFRIRWIFR